MFVTLRRHHQEIHYYKTRNGREVDFIVPRRRARPLLVQVCESLVDPATRWRESTALSEAMGELGSGQGNDRHAQRAGATITQRELRNESAAILRDVQAGQSIIVTRNGTPVAELRPVSPRRFVSRAAAAEAAQTMPRIDAARFRADLDAAVDPYVDV